MTVTHLTVPLKNIIVAADRGRKTFGRLQELAASIKTSGLFNPIYVSDALGKPGFYNLVAGERRYRASVLAGLTEVPVSYKDNLSPLQQKVIELEENTCRENLDWQEEAELHRQIDELKKKIDPEWTQAKTAELVQLSPAMVNRQIQMAQKLKTNPELKALVKDVPLNVAVKMVEQHEKVQKIDRLKSEGKLKITTDLILGDCTKMIKGLETASVDCLIMDPPFGLDALESMRESGGAGEGRMVGHAIMNATHNMEIENVLALLRTLAPELFRVLKPGAHWYCFCAVQYVGDFIKALAPLEFQPPGLVWSRGRNTSLGAFGYAYLSATEYVIFGHRPPKSKRLIKNMVNILEVPDVPKTLRRYPTQKPDDLLKTYISQSTNQGDLVLDCFAGSGSTLAAARALGRRGIGFEIDSDAWKKAQLFLENKGE